MDTIALASGSDRAERACKTSLCFAWLGIRGMIGTLRTIPAGCFLAPARATRPIRRNGCINLMMAGVIIALDVRIVNVSGWRVL